MPRKKKTEETEAVQETETQEAEAPKSEEVIEAKEDKKSKLAALKAKAKALAEGIDETKTKSEDIKKKVKAKAGDEQEEVANTLVPIEDYLKSSIHLGTRVITPDMKSFVYKRRADGLAVFNTALLDAKLREGAEYLAQFAPEDVVLIGKREAGWKAIELFSKVTGVRIFTKKYPAGILTNPQLENFLETDLIFICDPWLDKNALKDANSTKVPVMSICDTNNYALGITKIVPGNNKSAKSLGMILYLMAKLYVEKRKLKVEVPPISDWIDSWDTLLPPK